jgi:hypothetical protein
LLSIGPGAVEDGKILGDEAVPQSICMHATVHVAEY